MIIALVSLSVLCAALVVALAWSLVRLGQAKARVARLESIQAILEELVVEDQVEIERLKNGRGMPRYRGRRMP